MGHPFVLVRLNKPKYDAMKEEGDKFDFPDFITFKSFF